MKDFTKLSEGIKDLTVKRKHFRQVASDREQNKRKKTLDISISKLETSGMYAYIFTYWLHFDKLL